MRSKKGRFQKDTSRQKETHSSFGGTSNSASSGSGTTFDSSGTSDPRFKAPTYSQANPDDFSIHSSNLSKEDNTTTTTTNSSSGNPADGKHSRAARNSARHSVTAPPQAADDDPTSSAFSSWSPSRTQQSTQSSQPITSRKSTSAPIAKMLNRRRKQQQAADQAPKPSAAATSAIPKRAVPPSSFINLPKFTKRNDAEGTDALPSPASPAVGNTSDPAVPASAAASPAASRPATRHARFLPDPQMQPPANTHRPDRSSASAQIVSRLANRQGGSFQSALSFKRRISDDEASSSDAAGRSGSAMDLDSATDEGDPAQADEIAAIRPLRAAAGYLPPSSASGNEQSFEAVKSGASGSSGERPLSELLQDRLSTLHRTSSIAALAQLRRISGSDEPDGSDRGSDKEMDEDDMPLEQTAGQDTDPDSSNVKRETSDLNESQAAESVDENASRILSATPDLLVDARKRKRGGAGSPSVSVEGGTPKPSHKGRKKSREDQIMADYRKRQTKKGRTSGTGRSKQYVWIFPPAWLPGKDVPGQDPPHEGTILLVPQPEGYVDPEDDEPYRPKYRTKLLVKAPHMGCNDDPDVSVYLGQATFPSIRPGRDGRKYPGKEKPNRLRNSSVLSADLFATITHLAPKPEALGSLIDLKIVRGPGAEDESTRGSFNETDVEDGTAEKSVPHQPPGRILRAPSQRNQAAQRQAENAARQHPITGLVGPEHFGDFVSTKTGGSMFTRSTQNQKSAATTWEASSRLVQLEGVARSGPVGVMLSSQTTEPIQAFTQSQRRSARSTDVQNDIPRVGNWVLDPRTAEAVLAASQGRGPEYPESSADDDMPMVSIGGRADDQGLGASQTPEEQLNQGQQNTQRTALLKPQSAKARQYYATHAQESTHIPEYIKPALLEFLSSEGYKIEPESRLREKPKWMFDLCAANPNDGESMRLVLIVETSPPSATPHLINEQICQVWRDDANTSPWRDGFSRQLDSQTGNPAAGSYGILTISMDQHAQVQKELETVSAERENLEQEREKLSFNVRNLKKQKTQVEEKLKEIEQQHRAAALKGHRLQAELEAERERVDHLQLQLKRGIQSRVASVTNRLQWLEGDNERLKAQSDVLSLQSAKTDGPIRRKAAEWDAMKEKEAEAAIAREREAEAEEKSREARRQALTMALAAAGSPEERRRAEIMLAALNVPVAATTNGHGSDMPPGEGATNPPQGDGIVQVAAQGDAGHDRAPTTASSKKASLIEDELAELAAEAAALGEMEPVVTTGGRRSRRSAAAATESQAADPASTVEPPVLGPEQKLVETPASEEQAAESSDLAPASAPAATEAVSTELAPPVPDETSARAFAAAASAPGTAPSEGLATSAHPYQTVNPADLMGLATADQTGQTGEKDDEAPGEAGEA